MADALKLLGDLQNGGGLMVLLVLLAVEQRYQRRDLNRIFKHLGWE